MAEGTRRPPPKPYSRVSRSSLDDAQLARLVEVVALHESELHGRVHRYFGRRYVPEVVAEHQADLDAVRELHALLVHERQERVIDDHETGTTPEKESP